MNPRVVNWWPDSQDFTCPFCGGTFTVPGEKTFRRAHHPDATTLGVVHSIPYCVEFERLGVIEFVREARKAMEQGTGGPMS